MIDILSDIDTGSAVPEAFPALEAKYGDVRWIFKKYKKFWILLTCHQGSGLSVKNTGASWLVMLPSEGSSLTGGAIPGQFKVDFKYTVRITSRWSLELST